MPSGRRLSPAPFPPGPLDFGLVCGFYLVILMCIIAFLFILFLADDGCETGSNKLQTKHKV